MSFLKNTLLSAAAVATVVAVMPSSSLAAGFQLGEQSVTGLGRAFAGGGVVGDDLSAIAYNPAGMSLAKGFQMQAGFIGVHINSKLHGTYTPVSGPAESGSAEIKDIVPVPSFYVTYQMNDKFTLGLGTFASYGFDIEYDPDWFGRAHAVDSNLKAVTINPSVSYKINDKWSIGAGFVAQRMTAKLTADTSKMKAEDWAYGYDVGIMYEPFKDTRFGLSYRSQVTHELDGHLYYPVDFGVGTDLDLPAFATFGAYHKVNDWLGLSGTVRWTNWSTFKTLDIKNEAGNTISYVPENWKDTWYFAIGGDFYINDKWTARAGWAYDSNPIKGAEYRTARIPDTYRYIVSLGLSYKWNEHLTFDAGYMHVFFDNTHIDNNALKPTDHSVKSNLKSVYKSSLDLFGLQVQYKF